MSLDFYAGLAPLTRFAEITDGASYTPLPPDWHVVITDVRGSTEAIAAGRYKEVNMVGAASIVALLNAAGPVDIPFVFGGDGATLAIPADLLSPARAALGALQALAREAFDLELRAGVVPVADLAALGHPVRVARLAVSEHYAQAIFSGLAHAEVLIKDPEAGAPYLVPPAADLSGANLAGLECRWRDIPSRHGETVSLLVTPAPDLPEAAVGAVLGEAIAEIESVYGGEGAGHPIAVRQLRLSRDPRRLLAEARARVPRAGWPRLAYLARIWLLNLAVASLGAVEHAVRGASRWDRYRDLLRSTTDYRKYDDTLRMVLAGAPAQRERLEAYLAARFAAGTLAYGLHVADRALMTCLVFERMGRQVHFVDGADGGYALAAHDLKGRLAALRASRAHAPAPAA